MEELQCVGIEPVRGQRLGREECGEDFGVGDADLAAESEEEGDELLQEEADSRRGGPRRIEGFDEGGECTGRDSGRFVEEGEAKEAKEHTERSVGVKGATRGESIAERGIVEAEEVGLEAVEGNLRGEPVLLQRKRKTERRFVEGGRGRS